MGPGRGARLLAVAMVLLISCGRLQQAATPSGPYREIECRSSDEEGLITCHQAIDAAAHGSGSVDERGGSGGFAELATYQPQPRAERVRIWRVTYHDIRWSPSGPYGREPECLQSDWGIAVDATTGEWLVEGNTGNDVREIPCPD